MSLGTLAGALLIAGPSRAQDAKAECVAAHIEGQQLRKGHHLRKARSNFATCARPVCPTLIANDCNSWLDEIGREIPSLLIDARAPSGADAIDVRVMVDGEVLATRLDGQALEVDPGIHALRLELQGAKPYEIELVIHEGDVHRRVPVRFEAAKPSLMTTAMALPPPITSRTRRPVPGLVFALGGLSLLGGAGFALFGSLGDGIKRNLDAEHCAPFCSGDDVSRARRDYAIADVSLLVGAVSFGVGTVLFLTRPSVAPVTGASRPPSWLRGEF